MSKLMSEQRKVTKEEIARTVNKVWEGKVFTVGLPAPSQSVKETIEAIWNLLHSKPLWCEHCTWDTETKEWYRQTEYQGTPWTEKITDSEDICPVKGCHKPRPEWSDV